MILITGATGYLGRHLVKILLEAGMKIRCLVRDPKTANLPDVELLPGDIKDPVSLAVACTGVEIVIHLVSIAREDKNNKYIDINVTGTQNLVEVGKKIGIKHIIYVSTLWADLDPQYKYAYSKGLAEREITKDTLINYTILRPSVMFGAGFGFMDRIVQSLLLTPSFVALPGDGQIKFQPISVKDVAKCILIICSKPQNYKNQIIEIGGTESFTYEQILDEIMRVTNIKKAKLFFPKQLSKIAVFWMNWVMSDPPITNVELKQFFLEKSTSLDSVPRKFGFKPLNFFNSMEYLRYKIKKNKD